MPETAPQAKQQATKGYGAQVILKGKNFNETRLYMEELAKEIGMTIVHPYDDKFVMAGQGTIGLEILDDIWNVNTVIVPVGGGGLIAGIATALKSSILQFILLVFNLKMFTVWLSHSIREI